MIFIFSNFPYDDALFIFFNDGQYDKSSDVKLGMIYCVLSNCLNRNVPNLGAGMCLRFGQLFRLRSSSVLIFSVDRSVSLLQNIRDSNVRCFDVDNVVISCRLSQCATSSVWMLGPYCMMCCVDVRWGQCVNVMWCRLGFGRDGREDRGWGKSNICRISRVDKCVRGIRFVREVQFWSVNTFREIQFIIGSRVVILCKFVMCRFISWVHSSRKLSEEIVRLFSSRVVSAFRWKVYVGMM